MRKKCLMMALALMISAAAAGSAFAGVWQQQGANWYYIKDDGTLASGWEQVNGVWYYLDPATNIMKTGWLDIGVNRYYLDQTGAMQTGLFSVEGSPYQYEAYDDGRLMRNTLEDAAEKLTGAAFWHREDGTIMYKTANTEKLQNMWQVLYVGEYQQEQIQEQQEQLEDRIQEAMETLKERYEKNVYPARSKKAWADRLNTWVQNVNLKLGKLGVSQVEIDAYIADVKAGRYDDSYRDDDEDYDDYDYEDDYDYYDYYD